MLFGTPVARNLIAGVRAAQAERTYAHWRSDYQLRTRGSDPPEAERRIAERSAASLLRANLTRPRILFVGTDPAQDRSGLLQGLESIADVTEFTQKNGTYGQLTANGQLSFALTGANSARLIETVEEAQRAGSRYDLVIGQMWAGYIDPAALGRIKRSCGPLIVNIGMDDRHAFEKTLHGRAVGTRLLAGTIDLHATTAPECVDWFAAEGCPAVFMPEASDPELYRPMPELGKSFDVSFVGARYGIRAEIVGALGKAGMHCAAYGAGWPLGRLSLEKVPSLFARSRVVLGVGTVGHSRRLMSLKLRDFDGPMSGSCYVTSDNPDLTRVFDVGREICVYTDIRDCVRVVGALLSDEDRREGIASRGRARAVANHTWRHRFSALLDLLATARRRVPTA